MARIVVIIGHARTSTFCEALGEIIGEALRPPG
jgi:hypothetical protein